MEDDSLSFRYRVNYSENIAPKYPAAGHEGLEVVPSESPLYPLPPTQTHTRTPAPSHYVVDHGLEEEKWSPTSRGWTEPPLSAVTAPEEPRQPRQPERRRILGLTVPVFWALLVILVVILAAALGGGIGGGLKAQQSQKLSNNAPSDTSNGPQTSSSSGTTPSPTSSQASASTTAATSGATPSDGGCPLINGQTYTPYAVDGKPVPLQQGLEGQQFKQQCYTNYVSSPKTQTHDILRIFMPTLENCMMACAEYNSAYHANLANNTGVGGGYCVAVTIDKVDAGFCYLKNGTTTNDTLGHPDIYSSAVLLTDLNVSVS
ncbi:hypothetical protein F5Y05DRAFT_410949 [Hypoxylon sp. FL0543]|nr:hypothetical protein F5Y05DRAFT_410949 [Hypoxylon sp. FL0543]